MILGQETIVRRRFTAQSIGSDGRATSGAPTDTNIFASVQPLTGEEVQILPEGERHKDQKKIYTGSDLRSVDQYGETFADLVVIDGVVYKVMQAKPTRSIIPHYKARIMRLQEEVSA